MGEAPVVHWECWRQKLPPHYYFFSSMETVWCYLQSRSSSNLNQCMFVCLQFFTGILKGFSWAIWPLKLLSSVSTQHTHTQTSNQHPDIQSSPPDSLQVLVRNTNPWTHTQGLRRCHLFFLDWCSEIIPNYSKYPEKHTQNIHEYTHVNKLTHKHMHTYSDNYFHMNHSWKPLTGQTLGLCPKTN